MTKGKARDGMEKKEKNFLVFQNLSMNLPFYNWKKNMGKVWIYLVENISAFFFNSIETCFADPNTKGF